jgi:hypothetical protein
MIKTLVNTLFLGPRTQFREILVWQEELGRTRFLVQELSFMKLGAAGRIGQRTHFFDQELYFVKLGCGRKNWEKNSFRTKNSIS